MTLVRIESPDNTSAHVHITDVETGHPIYAASVDISMRPHDVTRATIVTYRACVDVQAEANMVWECPFCHKQTPWKQTGSPSSLSSSTKEEVEQIGI